MLLALLFPQLAGLQVHRIEDTGDAVVISASCAASPEPCPACGSVSARVHGRYSRTVADGAAGGRPVLINLRVLRFRCLDPSCPKVTFAMQAGGLTSRYCRRSVPLTFSELAAYRACGFAYRLRNLLGFQPFLAAELGYGKAVHHVLRAIAEYTLSQGRPPDFQQVWRMLDEGFFLPAASKPAHRQLKEAARQLLRSYLPTAIITGRADVILDKEGGEIESLAIVDYKTSTDPEASADYALQLAVYTDAGRREGLNVRAAYVHDLKAADRDPVDVSPEAIAASEQIVEDAVRGLRARDFRPRPGDPCRRCDVRRLCQWAPAV